MKMVVRPCPDCGALISSPDGETRAGTYIPLLAMIAHYDEEHRDA